ncbi:altronate dehydratase [Telmatocola sphagniphila]|uniref:Altronate dehydratase n=1 Tax=Telmatocola sphagniphila TaxID=1123043 RepID=A0A8E6BBK2_9BACT|nr:altronate dehydratase family protein [Telmatocola sphagniphila]QVL34731.1 altronate dehydratase [Telmatocola sphagniphila]
MTAIPLKEVGIHLRPKDNVAVAIRNIPAETKIQIDGVTLLLPSPVRMGHKFAVQPIKEGDPITKYGQTIGFAGRNIHPGEHVHVHNVILGKFERDYAYSTEVPLPPPPPATQRSFMGYDRGSSKPEHLRYGTRNYIAIISTVNCSAATSKYVAEKLRSLDVLKNFPNVDGILPIVHKHGCAMAYGGDDHKQLDRTLAGFARHPNVAAYILIGLGCETGQAAHLIENEHLDLIQINADKKKPLVLSIQECGGIGKTVEAGVKAVIDMLPKANDVRRVQVDAKHIILGTNCGGSDGNSGVTANPALGVASDLIVQQGGTSILGETTEIYGAEHLLTRRAVTKEVGEKLVERIKWWEWYTSIFGVEINNNPSVGNKEGGLTTIYEKSLGAIAKAGSTAMVDVVHYAEPVTKKGFVVMDTPGYDPVSMTGIVAGGANVLVFTTGRGSVFGCKPSPSIKVATNSPLYKHMEGDMDINAGRVLEGVPVEEVGKEIFEKILSVASGEKTKSEINGVGEEEFAPWGIGPTL